MNIRINKTVCLAECAAMLALSTVLSLIKVIQMPWGGSVTLLSMLPVCIFAIRRGCARGLACSFLYSVIQFFIGSVLSWGLDVKTLIICAVFDYFLPYFVLGFSGLSGRSGNIAKCFSLAAVISIRFLCHYVTGVTIWKNLEPWKIFGISGSGSAELYSLAYNAAYMLPELLFTLAAFIVLLNIKHTKKLLACQN